MKIIPYGGLLVEMIWGLLNRIEGGAMKSFYEMVGILGKGGLGAELNAVDFIQLSSGHWAGHNSSSEVFVSVAEYPMGGRPEGGLSTFKYEEGRRATAEESKEYWDRWREHQKSLPSFTQDSEED